MIDLLFFYITIAPAHVCPVYRAALSSESKNSFISQISYFGHYDV